MLRPDNNIALFAHLAEGQVSDTKTASTGRNMNVLKGQIGFQIELITDKRVVFSNDADMRAIP
jgi:hypothetical protein